MTNEHWQAIDDDTWQEAHGEAVDQLAPLAMWAHLAGMVHGDVSAERAYHAGMKTGQEAPRGMAPAPDPYEGVRHDVHSKRSNSGRTAKRVTRAGRTYVIGADPFREHGDPVRIDGITLTAIADAWHAIHGGEHECTCDDLTEDRPIYRKGRMVIRNGEPVTRTVALRACHCDPFPRLAGTDLRAFAEVTPEIRDTSYVTPSATHRTSLAGGLVNDRETVARTIRGRRGDGTPYVMTEHGEYGDAITDRSVPTIDTASHVTRTRLSMRPRKSDPTESTVDGVTALLAPAADREHVWHGHRLVPRAGAVKSGSDTRKRRNAATRAAAPWSPFVPAIAAAIGGTDPVVVNGVTVRLTIPGDTGRFRAHLTYCDGSTATIQARTADRVARAVDA
ncbi:MAG: hypothetical protein K0Q89_58 [Thermomicrobiales bacterium]|jgi:hypothetical protein|nr:hypothetical protein [Thermomicrobiales bacterium]